jgi:hypothetical protein
MVDPPHPDGAQRYTTLYPKTFFVALYFLDFAENMNSARNHDRRTGHDMSS